MNSTRTRTAAAEIRILVLRELPEVEQNLVWNLFSSDPARIATAFRRLQPRQPQSEFFFPPFRNRHPEPDEQWNISLTIAPF
jgi:hypothetical protein